MEGLLSTGPTPSSFKERWPDGGQDEEVQALQEGADQAAVKGVNQLNQAQGPRSTNRFLPQ